MAEKSPDAFRTISEVSEWLDTPTYVLRFWESRFSQIKPVKRAGGRRYYRPDDMLLLGGIKRLLHFDEHTIKAVKEILKEKGVKHVQSLSPDLDTPVVTPQPGTASETTAEIDRLVAESEAASQKLAKPQVAVRVLKKSDLDQTGEQTVDQVAPETDDRTAQTPTADDRPAGADAAGGAESTQTPQPETPAAMTDAQEEPAVTQADTTPAAPRPDDSGKEDWELMPPRIPEPVPFRIRAPRTYTQRQLEEIEVLYSQLSAIRDRLQAGA